MGAIDYKIKNIKGEYKPLNIFQFFDNGIRKRLPKYVAQEFYNAVISNIDSNRYGFQLSQRWIEYKTRVGADTRPFIMFHHYKKAITIYSHDGHLAVGFRKTSMHPRAKISMGRLAIQLEYGDLSRGLPARPLWRNTARDFFREKRKILKLMDKAIRDENKIA